MSRIASKESSRPTFGLMWQVMRSIGDVSLPTFFSSVTVQNSHLVPPCTTRLILCSTHASTIIDVAILSSHIPERRNLHFWAKSGIFKNPISRWILNSSGNIKVDRRTKNNQALFQETFQAMDHGGAIALFPEGGSYTIPAVAKLKMGAAWAALEYTRHLQIQGSSNQVVKVLPAAVVYSDKSRFRSKALLNFGEAISLDKYFEEFFSSPTFLSSNDHSRPTSDSSEPTPAYQAVARLTADLQAALEKLTFNAPDWESYQAVRVARELIWDLDDDSLDINQLDMEHFVQVSNSLLRLLSLKDDKFVSASEKARKSLFLHSCMLHLCNTQSHTLSSVLRRSGVGTSFPTARQALNGLLSVSKSLLIRLPYLVPIYLPTLLPTYILPSALAHRFAGREEESLSSVKTLFGFGCSFLFYLGLLFKVMHWCNWTPPGFLVGSLAVWWMVELNRSCIDTAYGLWKQLKLSFRLWRTSRTSGRGSHTLFFYGTLLHPKILARVLGNDGSHLLVTKAILPDHILCHVKGEEYPGLIPSSSSSIVFGSAQLSSVPGSLVSGLTDRDVRLFDQFEGDEYTRRTVTIEGKEAQVYAWTAPLDSLEGKVWDFKAFARKKSFRWAEGTHEHMLTPAISAVTNTLSSKPSIQYYVKQALRDIPSDEGENLGALLQSRVEAHDALAKLITLCADGRDWEDQDSQVDQIEMALRTLREAKASWPFESKKDK